jgi:hypothetical protein
MSKKLSAVLSCSESSKTHLVRKAQLLRQIMHPNNCREEVAYVLKYPEVKPSLSDGSESWVICQIGVYQQYCKSTEKSIWIFLCCKSDSKAQQYVTQLLNDAEGTLSAQQYPIVLHVLLFSCYLYNWRSYMLCFETELLKKVCEQCSPSIQPDFHVMIRLMS